MLSNDVLKSLIYQVQQTLVSRPFSSALSFWYISAVSDCKHLGPPHPEILVTCMVEQMDMLGK